MNSTATADSQTENISARLQKLAVAALFALVLVIPKVLNLRRDERSWTAFRVLLGIAGAALPPATVTTNVDDKARELGALVVVNGGKYRYDQGSSEPVSTQLFVGPDYIWALGSRLQTLLTIPVSEVSSVHAEETDGGWILRVRCSDRIEEFSFGGIFAEHFARVAENTLRGVMQSTLPILPRARAAGA
jgi:hypothetical protein